MEKKIPERFDEKIIGMGKSNFIPSSIPIHIHLDSNVGNLRQSVELIIDIDNRKMWIPNPSNMLPKIIPADNLYEKLIWRLYGFRNRIAFYNFIIEEARKKLINDWG